jgi:hypothetical protein
MEIEFSREALDLVRDRGGRAALDFIPPLGWSGRIEVSVDTYLRGKNLSRYRPQTIEGVEILVTPVLTQWASRVEIDASRFLFWKRFDVFADHAHRPTWTHGWRPAVGGLPPRTLLDAVW